VSTSGAHLCCLHHCYRWYGASRRRGWTIGVPTLCAVLPSAQICERHGAGTTETGSNDVLLAGRAETRVGYVPRWLSGRLFPAVTAANAAGLHVLVRAKMHPVRSCRELVVRSSDGADLRTWLMVTSDPPGDSFYEFDWTKPGRQFAFQDGISAVVAGADESTVFTCECVTALDRGPSSVDVVIAGRCVGQFSRFAGGGQ
jgi:hypothetical protein